MEKMTKDKTPVMALKILVRDKEINTRKKKWMKLLTNDIKKESWSNLILKAQTHSKMAAKTWTASNKD